MDQRISVTQLAADVRQVLLAVTVDIEQRWQFLTPEERVEILNDLVSVTLIYNRFFAETAITEDAHVFEISKPLTDQTTPLDVYTFELARTRTDTAAVEDVFARTAGFLRGFEDAINSEDSFDRVAQFVRSHSDIATPADALVLSYDKSLTDTADASDVYAAVTAFLRWASDAVFMAESCALSTTRSVQESVSLLDTPSKVFTTGFFDIGGPYAAVEYFADDYVEEGTGPAVYDSFTYALN